jgi:hypothetical protein
MALIEAIELSLADSFSRVSHHQRILTLPVLMLSTFSDGNRNASAKKGGDYDERYSLIDCSRSRIERVHRNGHVDRLEHIALLSPTARP